MDELKNCPFCGDGPILRRTVEEYPADKEQKAGEFDAHFQVDCDTCGVSIHDEYRSEAIAAWNRRVTRPSVSASPVAPETVKEALRDMIGAYMHVAGNEYRGDIDGLVEELAPYVVGLRSTSDRAASPSRPVEAVPVAWPDRETLRRQIESDPDEGEIGAGFELFSERGQQELERLAFEALPKWAQEHIRDLERQIASPPREPAGMDAATVEVKPLEWGPERKFPDAPWSERLLRQRIGHHNLGKTAGSYSVFECPDGKWGWASTWDEMPHKLEGSFADEASAIDAAQADYEARIRSALIALATPSRRMDAATVEACAVTAERFILQYATSSRDLDVVMQGAAKEDAAAEIAAAIRSLALATPSRRVG